MACMCVKSSANRRFCFVTKGTIAIAVNYRRLADVLRAEHDNLYVERRHGTTSQKVVIGGYDSEVKSSNQSVDEVLQVLRIPAIFDGVCEIEV